MAADLFSGQAGQGVAASHTDYPRLEVGGGDQGQAAADLISVHRLPDFHPGTAG